MKDQNKMTKKPHKEKEKKLVLTDKNGIRGEKANFSWDKRRPTKP